VSTGAQDPRAFEPSLANVDDARIERAAPGLVLGEKYRLVLEIGRGGMGSVWRAEHLEWRAPVAVKLMSMSDSPMARERFTREVRLAAALRSPHVVQVLDHGVDAATRLPFIAMELLEGESLAARLRRLRSLPPAEVLTIMTHLARALTRAHELGIVHRDLKPDNVYLVPNGDEVVTKILDFGVAKWFDSAPFGVQLVTAEGSLVGTPWYMSPEQLKGRASLDHRTDLWSLAVMACECLTGERPFSAHDFATLAVLVCGNGERPVPSRIGPVPAGFDAWFAKATARDVSQRFQSAHEQLEALRAVCGREPSARVAFVKPVLASTVVELATTAALSRSAERRAPGVRRRILLASALAAVASVGVVVSAALFARPWRSEAAPTTVAPELRASPASLPVSAPAVPVAPSTPPTRIEVVQPRVSVAEPVAAAPAVPATASAPAPSPRRDKPARRLRPAKSKPQAAPAAADEAESTIDGDRIIRTRL
jgi:serine/threonine-protein kinase